MRKIKLLVLIFLCLVLFAFSPSFQWLKSVTVMSVYSAMEARESLLAEKDIDVHIPGGLSTSQRDWYPFVMTFNEYNGFGRSLDRDLRMTVLYNFGAFPFLRSYSDYYSEGSPYYNSFYGAYAVEEASGQAFGYYADGSPNIDEMALVPTYDMRILVLRSIGCSKPIFQYEVTDQRSTQLLGEDGWFVFEADMTVSGPSHTFQKDYQAYIQYGRPPENTFTEDFPIVNMKGRIYAKHNEEKNLTLFFYCIAMNDQVITEWESDIMSATTLTW